jgi:hypothetical protein
LGDIASRPTPVDVGTIHLVAPFNDRLVLHVDNSDVIPRVAFGGTTAFDSPVAGTATLDFRTPWNHVVLLLAQLVLWVFVISATFNLKRIKSRMGVRREGPLVLDESTDSVLTFNKQDGAGTQ